MYLPTWAGTWVDTRMSHDVGRLVWDVTAGWLRHVWRPRFWLWVARGCQGPYRTSFGARYLSS